MFLPVDLAQERCLVTFSLTSLTPRALQVPTTDSLSENLKNTRWHLCGWWCSDAQVSDKNTQKLREKYTLQNRTKVHTTLAMSRNEKRTSANSVKFTFITRFFLSPGSYALDAWLASNPARVTIWVGVAGSTQPYTCHHLS